MGDCQTLGLMRLASVESLTSSLPSSNRQHATCLGNKISTRGGEKRTVSIVQRRPGKKNPLLFFSARQGDTPRGTLSDLAAECRFHAFSLRGFSVSAAPGPISVSQMTG